MYAIAAHSISWKHVAIMAHTKTRHGVTQATHGRQPIDQQKPMVQRTMQLLPHIAEPYLTPLRRK